LPATSRDVVIGVDIGTTSVKAVAFTPAGEAVAEATAAYGLRTPRPGFVEQDPREVVAACLEATARAAAHVQAAGDRVAALSFSAALHALVGIGHDDRELTPVVPWADARAADLARQLRTQARGLALHRRTGTPVHAISPLVKLRWFAEHEPELFARVRRWVGVKELVIHELTGEWVVDHGIASATGLLDLEREEWDREALAWAGVDAARLPELVAPTHVLALSPAGAERLGVPGECPLVVGGADGPLANLGVGAIGPGAVACSIGTSGALRVVADAPRVDEAGRVFCYALAPGRWAIGGAINNGGSVLDWVAEALVPEVGVAPGPERAARLLELAARAGAGSGGLLFLPHLLGERAPRWAPGARGAYVGLTRAHGRAELVRAAVEGVCFQLALVLSSLDDAGVEVREIRATGGFSRSALWRRVLAGIFGRPVGFARSPEGSALGAAMLGMCAVGMLADLDAAAALVTVERVEHPDPQEAAVYARLLPVFSEVAELLARPSEALTALSAAGPDLSELTNP
jgi:gluconokinase